MGTKTKNAVAGVGARNGAKEKVSTKKPRSQDTVTRRANASRIQMVRAPWGRAHITDLAPIIASVLIGMGRLPCGPRSARSYALHLWPYATADELERGYEIAVECWEDDYLFEAA